MSASQVSSICASLDRTAADLQGRDLSEVAYPCIWLDATYIRCRHDGHVQSTALVTAIGAGADGCRRLLGMDAIGTETYGGWHALLPGLRERGVSGVLCIAGDAHEGLKRAMLEVFPGSAWQRCIVHLIRNAAAKAPTLQKRKAIGRIMHAVLAERDPELVRGPCHRAVGAVGGFCADAAALLEDAEPDALAYLDFPYGHHVRLRTDNVQERANGELERRSRVVQVFPGRASLIRMTGAVFSEMDEERSERRWFNEASAARAVEGSPANAPAPSYAGEAGGHAARIMELVLAGNPIHGRKVA